MKYLLITVCLTWCYLSSCNGGGNMVKSNEVPEVVMSSFKDRYAEAENISWTAEKDGDLLVYQAAFEIDDQKLKAEFDDQGNFIIEE